MAKVTITIEDLDNGTTAMTMQADPPFPETPENFTSAQVSGCICLEAVREYGAGEILKSELTTADGTVIDQTAEDQARKAGATP